MHHGRVLCKRFWRSSDKCNCPWPRHILSVRHCNLLSRVRPHHLSYTFKESSTRRFSFFISFFLHFMLTTKRICVKCSDLFCSVHSVSTQGKKALSDATIDYGKVEQATVGYCYGNIRALCILTSKKHRYNISVKTISIEIKWHFLSFL